MKLIRAAARGARAIFDSNALRSLPFSMPCVSATRALLAQPLPRAALASRRPAALRSQRPLRTCRTVAAAAKDEPLSSLDSFLLVVGGVSAPVCLFSEWTLFETGCGLPAGPGGAFGAIEGVSYLALVAFLFASVQRKVTTGTGLPAGPGGALGAVEGVVYLAALAGIAVAGQQLLTVGELPNAIPVDGGKCA